MLRWLLLLLLVAVMFDVAVRAEKPQPAMVIVCEEGAIFRRTGVIDTSLATGSTCVLADRYGDVRVTADSIVVYDNTMAAP